MKRILFFFSAIILFSGTVFSQGSNCASATPFCGNVTFPNNTSTSAQSGPSYGCLGSEPNPAWFIIKTTANGTMTFNISQATGGGSAIDVDFIAWGPYSSTNNICNALTGSCSGDHNCSGNIEDCSYNPAAVETMTLVSPAAGQYYMIMITNYSGQSGNITFNQTSGPPTDCSITCPSVTSGNGFLLAGGGNMPATVACNAASFGLIASGNTPFGNPITPGIMISFTSTANSTLQINWYENAAFVLCSGCGGTSLPIPASTNNDIQYSTMSPSATNQIQLCETSTASGDFPYTITDVSSGAVLSTGTWVTDAACLNINFPPGTISGVASWTISPACPGCLTSTDWGYTTFSPAAAAAAGGGTYNICYSFDPPGTCPTYTYCQSITVTNPNTATWTTPAAMCANAASVNLNALITGTTGGTWSGTGVSGSTFNPTGLSGSIPVTYTVGSGGCSATVTHNITVNPVPTVSITPASATVCAGVATTLTANPSIGGGTYSWLPGGATTSSITVTPGSTTTYTVTYTLAGCSATATRIITVNPIPTVTVNNASMCAGNSVSLTATPSIAGGTYSWSPGGGTTQTVSVSPASTTTYTVTYTLSGCSNTGAGVVTVNPLPTVSISPASSTICSSQSATLNATPSTGGGTYSWLPGGATTAAITVSPGSSTTYTVTYTLSGCSATATRLITVNPSPTVTVNTPAAICAGQSASLTANPSLGGGTYSWSPGGGTTQTISVAPGSTTTYTVTYTLSGCSGTGTSTVTVNPLPTVGISPATSTICAGTSATLTATPSLGGGTYSWSPGGATTSAITVSPGSSATYTVTYSLSGCSATNSRLITVNPVPTVSVNSPAAVCSGQSVTLTATPSSGGGTYSWLPGGATTQSITVSPGSSTTYTVTYTLAGCSGTGTGTVTINPVPTVSINPLTSTICAGSSATLTASPSLGGGTYSWSPGGATTSAITVSPSSSTTYTVTYTLSGCVGTASRLITVNPMDNASFTYGSSTYCQSGTNPSATITGLAGGTFSSSPGGLVMNTSTGLITLASSTLGSYTVTYTTNGACPNTSTVPINITSAPSATFSYAGPFCKNGTNPSPTFPAGSSAGTFTSSPAGLVFVNANTGQINLTTSNAGTYTVTNSIAASGGCAAASATFSVTINPAPVVTATPASQTICSGTATSIALTSSLGSTTYNWTVTQSGVSGASAGSGSSITQTLNTTSAASGSATYTINSLSGGCAGTPITVIITVNPIPTVTPSPVAQTICSGNTTSISLSGSLPGTTFSWIAPTQTNATGGAAGSGSSIVQSLTATGSTSGTVTYNVVPTANSCPGSAVPVIITVNPSPVVTATPATSTICSGAATSVNLTSTTAGTTYSWIVTATPGISGTSAGSGSSISQVLTNSTTLPGTATYTVTPTAAGCPGNTITVTVTVNPLPNVTASPSSQTICSGNATSITLSGTIPGTTFSWGVPTMGSATGGTAGSGSSIIQTLLASGSSAGTVTYNVTPTASTCPGAPVSVVITVNPVPFVTASPATSTICSGATTSINLSSFTSGTTFSWTAANGAGISGASPGSGTSIAQTLNNSSSVTAAATYTVTPSASGCPGNPITVTVNVNPVPNIVATPSSQSICSGSATGISLSGNVSGTVFSWGAPTQTNASGGTSGSGSSITQTLTATGTTPGSVVYTITPTANSCPGTPVTVTIDVNPNPIASGTPVSTAVCSGTATSIPLTSNIAGTTFDWTVTSTGASGATAGSGNNISQILTATGTTPGTVTYNITATTPAGCTSTIPAITITVNPTPDVTTTPANATICSGSATSIALTSSVAGTTFSWTVAQTDVSGAASGNGSTIAQTLTAMALTPGTAVYTITPSASGCASGSPVDVTITVNPLPTATATPSTQTICTGSVTSINLSSNLSSTSFDWTVVQTGVSGANAGTGTTIADLLNITGTTAGSAVYTITPTDNSCSGSPITVTINVNPIDVAAFSYSSSTYCQTGSDPTPTITGTPGGVFHFIPAGLVIDSVSGLIDVSLSAIGTYSISYQTNGPCPNNALLTVTITNAPNAAFAYFSPVCSSDPNPTPHFPPGASSGVFSCLDPNLVIDPGTGEINLLSSLPGTYTITNDIPPGGGCAATSATGTITISPAATVDAGINDSVCEAGTISLTGLMGGSATSTIWTTGGTGTFGDTTSLSSSYSPSAADVANGFVVLTITTNDPAGACPSVNDFMVLTITPLDSAEFAYSDSTFCQSGANPIPTITGVAGGTFSSTTGLVFVSTATGEINLSASALGTYFITYTTNGICPNSSTSAITITPAPSATFTFSSSATSFCQSDPNPTPVFGTGANAGVFTVNPSTGLSFVNDSTGEINLVNSVPGTYTIINTIGASGGCAVAIDSLTITINQPATVNAGNDTTICAGNTYTISSAGFGGSATSTNWTSNGSGSFDNAALLNATYTPSAADITSGSVTLTLTTNDPSGVCNAVSDSLVLTITPLPIAPSVSNPPAYCDGSVVNPLTSGSNGGTINWYSDAALTNLVGTGNPYAAIGVTTDTSFWVNETIGSCVSPASQVTISFNPLPVADTNSVITSAATCGNSTGSITGVAVVSGQNPITYVWQNSSGSVVGNSLDLTNVGPGVYTLTITDGNGCVTQISSSSAFNVSSTNGVTASFIATPTIGEKPLLVSCDASSTTGATSYLWDFGTGASSTLQNPVYTYNQLGSFNICLYADNGLGCRDTACTIIDVYINSTFVIPNVFTPNGDDVNDIFTVKNVGLETLDAEIYNRWGQKEYEWHTTNGGWDGRTAAGVLVPDGTYFFVISAKGIDGKDYFEKGAFSLIR
jgi:gliding motility-associated-like protein